MMWKIQVQENLYDTCVRLMGLFSETEWLNSNYEPLHKSCKRKDGSVARISEKFQKHFFQNVWSGE